MTFYITNLKLISLTLFLCISFNYIIGQDINLKTSDSIVSIVKKNGENIRGILISKDNDKVIVESGNNKNIIVNYSDIRYMNVISSEEIKKKKEFEKDNPNYTQHTFLPTAFTTEKGKLIGNSHYFITYNLKYGITDNLEVNMGSLFINAYLLGISYSKEIFDFLNIGISSYGGFTWFIPDNPNMSEKGIGFIPRISIGNKNRSIIMGFTTVKISSFNNWAYGGYIGAQKKIKEKWTISGELSGLTFDSNNVMYFGDVSLGYFRKNNVVWNFGVAGIDFNDPLILPMIVGNEFPFIPLPYFGYLKYF